MIRRTAIVVLATGCLCAVSAQPASASIGSTLCGVAGLFSGVVGKACNAVSGPVGGLVEKVLGAGSSSAARKVAEAAGLLAVGAWVVEGAKFALSATAKVMSSTTSPQLRSTWFSGTYWRMVAIAALLTLPFLFAAVVQALMRSDLPLLMQATFGYLPLAILASAIAAPVTMLLLAGSDEMSSIVSSAAGHTGSAVLGQGLIVGILGVVAHAPFLTFLIGLLAAGAAVALWLELAIREAAVYVVVLMLPLAFSAMVWPARRVWAVRSIELLIALILSKFVIVAVLTLGGGALGQIEHLGIASALAGVALLVLATLSPWALVRLLPLSELASGAVGSLRNEVRTHAAAAQERLTPVTGNHAWTADDPGSAERVKEGIREQHAEAGSRAGDDGDRARTGTDDRLGATGRPGAGTPEPLGGLADSGGEDGNHEVPAVFDQEQAGHDTGAAAPNGHSANGHSANGDYGTSASNPIPDGGVASTPGERLSGLPDIWQAEDGQHRAVTLGSDYQAGEPVWPLDGAGGSQQPGYSPGEDHNPLPERQPPEDTES